MKTTVGAKVTPRVLGRRLGRQCALIGEGKLDERPNVPIATGEPLEHEIVNDALAPRIQLCQWIERRGQATDGNHNGSGSDLRPFVSVLRAQCLDRVLTRWRPPTPRRAQPREARSNDARETPPGTPTGAPSQWGLPPPGGRRSCWGGTAHA